jgi:hypothetical protein
LYQLLFFPSPSFHSLSLPRTGTRASQSSKSWNNSLTTSRIIINQSLLKIFFFFCQSLGISGLDSDEKGISYTDASQRRASVFPGSRTDG